MKDNKTYYEILNVNQEASIAEIKASFRRLALKYHPDKNKNSRESNVLFQIICNAYKTLVSIEGRKDYDTYLKTSSIINKRFKEIPKDNKPTSYFYAQLNYILWEIEDILHLLRKKNFDKEYNGKSIKQWLLEILLFIDKWILQPNGYVDYFYEARQIDKIKLYGTMEEKGNIVSHKPYVSFEDYFYEIRKRMNKFIEKRNVTDSLETTNNPQVKIINHIIEALKLSFHYLGLINSILSGNIVPITSFKHTNSDYEDQKIFLLDRK
ncbi:MAG: hypothetical protein A2086_16965 [Spirochaetes bacterium GWD1_27_9]|nr:MAG: hypothetical protein A2Z98_18235 [Spirochaetes bacterium GWB1_27_13]OHD27033.1 MAG: hypothetical protein A2Y34_18365 [Spirochaetes bacterium GWC1_27_15]OHD29444.1 MAG: hypothetical protein A2086_16965 [Spirochaetes bacterium GWD1_27_9]